MSKSTKFFMTVLLLIILILSQFSPVMVKAGAEPPKVAITSATSDSITFEVGVPLNEMVIETARIHDQTYANIRLPGFSTMSQAGAPQLPFLTEVLGVPFESEIHVSVVPGSIIRRSLSDPVLPVTSESVGWNLNSLTAGSWDKPIVANSIEQDPEVYKSDNVFPGDLSKITNDAVLRSQRLVSIALYPIQYDPVSNELIIYDRLEVTVKILGGNLGKQSTVRAETPVYEKFFQDNLLNYVQAKAWREDKPDELTDGGTVNQTPWSPPDPGWRIKVHEAGFYKVTFTELSAAGIPIESIDINTLKMFHLGEEIAIMVIPDAAIVFYGESIKNKYTDENVYWLTYGGEPGLRMQSIDGSPTGDPVPAAYSSQQHLEQDRLYRSKVPGIDDLDRFLWGYVYRNDATIYPWSFDFSLEDYNEGDLSMTLSLIGYLQVVSLNPDHHAGIAINGTRIADITWDGFSPFQVELQIPEALLLPGANNLEVTALTTGYSQDLFFIDWLDIGYRRTFTSESGRLDFSYATPGDWQFELTDFVIDAIDVYDVSNALAPISIDNIQITGENAHYSAEFHDQIESVKKYIALDQNSYLTVDFIETDIPSDLFSASNGADYLMISHHDFLAAASALQNQKTAQGLRTELIDVQDIYDEFGYGIEDVYAIRNFIAFAYENWLPPSPAYVLLIGDGHFDPKNNLGYGRTSFIPPFLAHCDPEIGETAADNRYVSIIGDDELPDLMLGRLSVNTVSEAQSIINKIIAYETNPPKGDWKRQILAVTDNLDIAHYPLISESLLQDYFPSEPFEATKVYWQWTHNVLSEARADIQNAFNEGKLLVNYIGHGYYSGWADEDLFTTRDIPNLQPQDKLPVILAMTCMEGYFISPYLYSSGWEAMGEVITRTAGKGAVASWSPTGWGSVYGHDFLDRGFFKAVYQDGTSILSGAVSSGILNLWATGNNLDLLDTYLLFGDPAMQLNLSMTAVRDNYSVFKGEVLSVSADQGVLANDINPDNDPLTVILVNDVGEGSLNLNEDGSFVYTPNYDYEGQDSFSYKVNDGAIDSNTVTVQINVKLINHPPVAEDQVVTTLMDTPVAIELRATDDGVGGPGHFQVAVQNSHAANQDINAELVFELLTQPAHGTLSGDLPFLVYTPEPSYAGMDQFTFKANDGEFDSNIARVTIYINQPVYIFLPIINKP